MTMIDEQNARGVGEAEERKGFLQYGIDNPSGYSARRIGDFYAGLMGNFDEHNYWKKLRVTPADHHPVHDALGNAEAFERLLRGER